MPFVCNWAMRRRGSLVIAADVYEAASEAGNILGTGLWRRIEEAAPADRLWVVQSIVAERDAWRRMTAAERKTIEAARQKVRVARMRERWRVGQ